MRVSLGLRTDMPTCRSRQRILPSLLVTQALCLVPLSTPLWADETALSAQEIETAVDLQLWVQSAPLSMVIEEIGALSGKTVELQSVLDQPVSARLSGSIDDALSSLAADYSVLFDTDQEWLRASDSREASSVSVAVVSDELGADFLQALFADMAPGNDIEIRPDALRVTGHPEFVRRTTARITGHIASGVARQLGDEPAPVVDIVSATVTNADALATGEQRELSDSGNRLNVPVAEVQTSSADSGTTADGDVVDSGSVEMLADIAQEGSPGSNQTVLTRPIRWVTDIPGYDTF